MSQTLELEMLSSESISSAENADDSNLKKKSIASILVLTVKLFKFIMGLLTCISLLIIDC